MRKLFLTVDHSEFCARYMLPRCTIPPQNGCEKDTPRFQVLSPAREPKNSHVLASCLFATGPVDRMSISHIEQRIQPH